MTEPLLTVVIPTKNRPDFLSRLLHYYADTRSPYSILIGDSSDPEILEETQSVIQDFRGTLQVNHRSYPTYEGYPSDLGLTETLSDLLEHVATKYVVLVADDDVVIPDAIAEAVRFLELHSDYSAVHGKAALCGLSGRVQGDVKWIQPYPMPQITGLTALERLRSHFRTGRPTEFSVKVTQQMRRHWQMRRALGMNNRFGELLVSCLGVIQGKVHHMDRLYMVRQGHPGMRSRNPAIEELITNPAWSEQYVRFRDTLTEELMRWDGIPPDQAKDEIQRGFFYYMVKIMLKKGPAYLQGMEDPSSLASQSPLWRRLAQRSPVARRQWQRVRSMLLPGEVHRMTLPALLRAGSPTREDFVPVYRSLTGEEDA